MTRLSYNIKRQSRGIRSHLKHHHKKYIFGLISAALLYKVMSLMFAAIFINNVGSNYSYADDIESGTNIVQTQGSAEDEQSNSEENTGDAEDQEPNNEEEIGNNDETPTDNELETGDIDEISIVEPICDLGDINILKPISGDILNGNLDIHREYKNNDCSGSEFIIKLRDSNIQYVTIGTANYNATGIMFDSSMLYSGFYNITGLNTSGVETVIYTGKYQGLNSRYFSGHKIVIHKASDMMEVLYEGNYFTIDNISPSLSNVRLNVAGITGNYAGLGKKTSVSFTASEEITGAIVNILGVDATLESKSGYNYEYILYLGNNNTSGNIIYNISFKDLAGNTGYYENHSDIKFDNSIPTVVDLVFTKTGNYVNLQVNTSETSKLNFVYALSGTNTGYNYNTSYLTSHVYTFSGVSSGQYYNYSISVRDLADNIGYVGGYFKISGDNVDYNYNNINSSSMLVGIGFNTGNVNTGSFSDILLAEIEKFTTCKNGISNLRNIKIPVGSYSVTVKMPALEKTYVKKLISAFALVLFERIEGASLNKESIDKITADFNDFLIILKLVQDDDNQCEQNLSNYYMSKFRNNLIKYNLTIK